MKFIIIILFIVLAAIQWVVPSSIIWKKENILKNGKEFLFRTEPIDPSSPFEGKYINLNYQQSEFKMSGNEDFDSNDEVYVIIENKDGFAAIANVLKKKPSGIDDYVIAKVKYASKEGNATQLHLDYPFDRFYMEEYKATKAEQLYRTANRDTTQQNSYAVISILDGEAAIKDVKINDVSINQLIK